MLIWLSENLINVALVAALSLIVGLLIYSMVRDKRAGKSSCGGNCASCGVCHGCDSCGKLDYACLKAMAEKERSASGCSAK